MIDAIYEMQFGSLLGPDQTGSTTTLDLASSSRDEVGAPRSRRQPARLQREKP
jgi:hypothetical protein